MYTFVFTDIEKELFNLYKREKTKLKDMSIYEHLLYMFKCSVDKGCPGSSLIGKSYTEILKFINYKRRKRFTENELRGSLNRLSNNKLLNIFSSAATNEYSFVRFEKAHPFPHPNPHPLNASNNVDVAYLEDNERCTNLQTTEKDSKDIDTKSTTTVDALYLPVAPCTSPKEIKFLSSTLEKVDSWSEIKEDLFAAFKVAKVRSHKIKSEVISRIEKNITNITKQFKYNYILKTVLQVKDHFEKLRKRYQDAIFQNKSKPRSGSDDFEQRNYNFKELEKKLLGWRN